MSDEMLVRYGSPTLAGLKTGSLFVCEFADGEAMRGALRRANGILTRKGVRLLPLRTCGKKTLLYLYRPKRLLRDLGEEGARSLLREFGYPLSGPEKCVSCLIERLRRSADFPHEIGLFLGYPPEDVRGFIECGAENCKCSGCWKVYGDVESAQKTFRRYRICTDRYLCEWRKGRSLERLTVSCR